MGTFGARARENIKNWSLYYTINRDWPSPKESLDEKPIQEIRIDQVSGDVHISQSGNNVLLKSETEYEITFQVLKDKIRSDTILSDEGKETIIEKVEILEEEEKKDAPDKGKAQRAYARVAWYLSQPLCHQCLEDAQRASGWSAWAFLAVCCVDCFFDVV